MTEFKKFLVSTIDINELDKQSIFDLKI